MCSLTSTPQVKYPQHECSGTRLFDYKRARRPSVGTAVPCLAYRGRPGNTAPLKTQAGELEGRSLERRLLAGSPPESEVPAWCGSILERNLACAFQPIGIFSLLANRLLSITSGGVPQKAAAARIGRPPIGLHHLWWPAGPMGHSLTVAVRLKPRRFSTIYRVRERSLAPIPQNG